MQDVILEPISTGDIIDRSIKLYRRNFAALVLIGAAPGIVAFFGNLLSVYGSMGPSAGGGIFPANILWIILGSFIFYVIYPFLYLLMLAGLVRSIADHIMLGHSITFKGTARLVKARFGQLILVGFLAIVLGIALFIALYIVLVIVVLIAVLVFGGLANVLPPWLYGFIVFILILALIVGVAILLLAVLSRIIFVPQIVMIEGVSAGAALSRSIKLGAKNWYRLLAIVLFDFFIGISIAMALLVPFAVYAYFAGLITVSNPYQWGTWLTVIWAFAQQVSSILTTPIAAVSFTLLYFDNRVRKEAYDVDLIVRRIAGLTPVPAMPPRPAAQVRIPVGEFEDPGWAQAGFLGLNTRPVRPNRPPEPASVVMPEPPVFSPPMPEPVGSGALTCAGCNQPLMPDSSFCEVCGRPVGSPEISNLDNPLR